MAGDDGFVVDSSAENVVDPVGAGDALLAYATLGMLASQNPVAATIIGNFAAGVACERDGNVPVSVEDVRHKMAGVERNI